MIKNNTNQKNISWLQNALAIIRCEHTRNYNLEDRLLLDLHMDSLEMVDLLFSIEHKFGLSVNEADWMQWITVKDIVLYLDKITGKAD